MYSKALVFLFLVGCTTTPKEIEKLPPEQPPSEVEGEAKEAKTSKGLPIFLIRKMGLHGVVLGAIGLNINPLDSTADEENQKAIQGQLSVGLSLLPLPTDAMAGPSINLGRNRLQCGEIIVELKGESDQEFFFPVLDELQPRKVKRIDAAAQAVRFKAELKNKHVSVDAFEVDLDGDGTIEKISLVRADGTEMPESMFLSVQSGESISKTGYQKGMKLMGTPFDGPHLVSLSGIGDIDHDGKMEIMLMHSDPGNHLHKLVVYKWNAKLEPVLDYTWGERDCNPDFETWPKD